MNPIVIAGTGLAGYSLAKEFRKRDPDTPLVLITADDGRFYSKPMLSNALSKGKTADTLATANATEMAAQLNATVLTNTSITTIDREQGCVRWSGGVQAYRKLVLCLGANPIRIPFAGDGAGDVLSINNLGDYDRFRQHLASAKRVMILGAGLIGCEFANDLASQGFSVSVADLGDQVLGRLLPPQASSLLQSSLETLGVSWHLGTGAERIDRAGEGYAITLGNGARIEADLVLSAVGLRANTALAGEAGLVVNRGIVGDAFLRTSAPNIFALGDCLEVGGLVLPYVMPLMTGARALAQTLSDKETPLQYPAMPVVVKTPAHPVVVAPPAMGSAGQWRTECTPLGCAGYFEDGEGKLLGFALTGDRIGEKAALTKQLPPPVMAFN